MKNLKKLMPIMCVFLLTGCDGKPFGSEDFLGKLFPNPWDALMVFCAFIVLLFAAFFFAYKPIKAFQKKRADYVEGKISEAEQREETSRGLIDEANKEVAESKKTAVLIVEKAKEDANKQKEEILKQAKQEADEQKQQAKQEIEAAVEASKDEIHREIVSVAIDASEKVLGREVNDEDNKRLIEDFVNELEETK